MTDDLISRKAAIAVAQSESQSNNPYISGLAMRLGERIRALPAADAGALGADMTDPAEIAKKLTPVQIRALRSTDGLGSKIYPPDLREAEEMVRVAMMTAPGFSGFNGKSSWTLTGWIWDKDPNNRRPRLNARVVPTDLGRAVLAALDAKEST